MGIKREGIYVLCFEDCEKYVFLEHQGEIVEEAVFGASHDKEEAERKLYEMAKKEAQKLADRRMYTLDDRIAQQTQEPSRKFL